MKKNIQPRRYQSVKRYFDGKKIEKKTLTGKGGDCFARDGKGVWGWGKGKAGVWSWIQ